MKGSLWTLHKNPGVDNPFKNAYNRFINAKKGRSSLPTPVREQAVGASLCGVGGEGRPGAALLNESKRAGNSRYRVTSVTLLRGIQVVPRYCIALKRLFRGVFCWR